MMLMIVTVICSDVCFVFLCLLQSLLLTPNSKLKWRRRADLPTPMIYPHIVRREGDVEVVSELIKAKADVNAQNKVCTT